MAQKDKVKELVGRGLNSYHTKALQQMDRIEKKNKEQNHKISILSNELDNDYLTKTEEGSVVSLEHSKEGMVYLDELQGNTLVNYCTDGSKEMTLNGDIDLEGTFVTTTEGVDNGLVDVMCEGNTLVNLCKLLKVSNNVAFLDNPTRICGTVTIINAFKANNIYINRYNMSDGTYAGATLINSNVFKLDIPTGQYVGQLYDNASTDFISPSTLIEDVLILEGDWTNKEIPPYFEGMKSVGQDDENGHKIEILSQNKNLIDLNRFKVSSDKGTISIDGDIITFNYKRSYPTLRHTFTQKEIDLLKGKTFKFGHSGITDTVKNNNLNIRFVAVIDGVNKYFTFPYTTNYINTVTLPNNIQKLEFSVLPNNTNDNSIQGTFTISKMQLVFADTENTNYVKHSLNKKEILLNEPLRGLPNGINDRFVKIGGKCYIERNRGVREYQEGDLDLTDVITDMTNTEYSLETPIYEPLEIEPTLFCYSDTTHISNNSIIPCNMKIQNSGYNAIIKPSTLYTIALDTNQSGTIGMNLGGVKGTTTNNVLKLTTPATLTDDSLRLYGKGIKGSKVRILEGDKTNWIPSFFEGMKSSFEDKFDTTDNTYKMEILSNDISLFDLHNRNFYIDKTQGASNLTVNGRKIEYDANGNYRYLRYDRFNFVRGKKYTIVIKGNNSRVLYYNNNNLSATGITSDNIKSVTFIAGHNAYTNGIENGERGACKVTIEDVWIYEGDYDESKHTTTKSNKIQFSSIEPLRGIKNIKDRFIFKDGKLMIERNIKNIVFDGSQSGYYYASWYTDDSLVRVSIKTNTTSVVPKNKYNVAPISPKYPGYVWYTAIKHESIHIGGSYDIHFILDSNRFKTKDLQGAKEFLSKNPIDVCYVLEEPIYEEIPFELQKIILEGYENGTLFFDTNIPPTSTVTYAGETPIVKSVKLNKTEVLNNTNDINDNIVPYLMDMDYRVVCLQLESNVEGISMARLFGGAYEMLQRDIQSKRYSIDEYRYRLDAYLSVKKITEDEYNKLGDMLND